MQSSFNCPKCNTLFNQKANLPQILSCRHDLCKKCCFELFNKQQKIICPVQNCNQETLNDLVDLEANHDLIIVNYIADKQQVTVLMIICYCVKNVLKLTIIKIISYKKSFKPIMKQKVKQAQKYRKQEITSKLYRVTVRSSNKQDNHQYLKINSSNNSFHSKQNKPLSQQTIKETSILSNIKNQLMNQQKKQIKEYKTEMKYKRSQENRIQGDRVLIKVDRCREVKWRRNKGRKHIKYKQNRILEIQCELGEFQDRSLRISQ